MLKIPTHKNQDGQVAFEFILVVSFALGTIFLFFQMSFNAVDGYLVHYANYMASRAYLSSENGSNSVSTAYSYAAEVAQDVYETYPLKALKIETEFNVISYEQANALFSGTTASFEKSTNFFVGVGGGDKAKLVSESFLGKEPVRKTCLEQTCEALVGDRGTCADQADSMDITLYDNGC